MLTPLEISFHGLERSDAVEPRVREKFKRIEDRFDRATHARVVIEAPQRRTPLPKQFHVKIEIGIPGRAPILAEHDPTSGRGDHADVMFAIRDAFNSAERQIDALVDRMDHPARHEKARRKPAADKADGD